MMPTSGQRLADAIVQLVYEIAIASERQDGHFSPRALRKAQENLAATADAILSERKACNAAIWFHVADPREWSCECGATGRVPLLNGVPSRSLWVLNHLPGVSPPQLPDETLREAPAL